MNEVLKHNNDEHAALSW